MEECPNPECRKIVDGHQSTLYGKDGMTGLVACVKQKLARNTALIVLLAILSSAGGVTVYGLEAAKKDRNAVAENKQEIGNMKANLEWIKVTVEENHQNLNDIKEQIDQTHMTPVELRRLIEEAVRKGNNPG